MKKVLDRSKIICCGMRSGVLCDTHFHYCENCEDKFGECDCCIHFLWFEPSYYMVGCKIHGSVHGAVCKRCGDYKK